jgi:YVTN family beta-propeller protein
MRQENNLALKRRMTSMTNKQVFRGGLAALAGIALCTVSFSFLAAQEANVKVYAGIKGGAKLRIVQNNSAGDSVSIIDPATNKVVGEIKGIEAPHGVTVAKDGSRIYITSEADDTVVVVDGKTLQETKRIPLSGVPNLVQLTPDERRLYVSITLRWDDLSAYPEIKAAPSGGVDVIDTSSLTKVKTIAIKGGIHDLYISPDGKYVVAGGSRGAKPPTNLGNVIDTQTNEIAWTFSMSPSPSPMAISAKADGSSDKIYAQNGKDNGFAVVDFATHAVSSFVKFPDIPPAQQNPFGPPSPSHGIGITSDQKTLVVNSNLNSTLYSYSLPDLNLLGSAPLSGKGAEWLTITPDDKTAYVANAQTNNVSVVDIKSMKETAVIPVGALPARNTPWIAP